MSNNGSKADGEKENRVVTIDESEDEDDPIDDDQLDDYKEMIEELGAFPVSGNSEYTFWAVSKVINFSYAFCRCNRTK